MKFKQIVLIALCSAKSIFLSVKTTAWYGKGAGCESADEPKIEACRVGYASRGIRMYCIEGFKFVTFVGFGNGATQLFSADGKPIMCNCGKLK